MARGFDPNGHLRWRGRTETCVPELRFEDGQADQESERRDVQGGVRQGEATMLHVRLGMEPDRCGRPRGVVAWPRGRPAHRSHTLKRNVAGVNGCCWQLLRISVDLGLNV
jgi:hypothetical protein